MRWQGLFEEADEDPLWWEIEGLMPLL